MRRVTGPWLRWVLWGLVGLSLVVLVLGWVGTRGPVPGWLLRAQVARQLGLELQAQSVRLTPLGTLELRGVEVQLPESCGLPDDARRILQARRASIELDWSGWLPPVPRPTRIVLEGAQIRLSQDLASGELNLAHVRLSPPTTPPAGPLPVIELIDGRFELGEHAATGQLYRALTRLGAQGWSRPREGLPSVYDVRIVQTGRDTRGLGAWGEVDVSRGTGQASVGPIDLSRWSPQEVPSIFRDLWRQLSMEGLLERIDLRYWPASGVQAELTVSGVSLNLPIPAGQLEVVGARTARMEDVQGTIALSREGLQAHLEGLFSGVSCRLELQVLGLQEDAPYRAQVYARPFRLSETPRLLWFLQPVVRQTLEEQFNSPDALLEAQISIRRAAAVTDPLGRRVVPDPVISGNISFSDGAASYAGFPYALSQLAGQVSFNAEAVRLINVTGRGPTGAALFMEGSYAPPTTDGALAVTMTLADVPLDEAMFNALDAAVGRGTVDLLFSREQYAGLVLAGLLPPPGAGGFALGGRADKVFLTVQRAGGADQPFTGTARAEFATAGIVSSEFPFPVVASDLVIELDPRLVRVHARRVVTLDNTPVTLTAAVPIRRGQAARAPEDGGLLVDVSVAQLPITPTLLYALPGGGDRVLRELGLGVWRPWHWPPGLGAAAPASGPATPAVLLARLNPQGRIDASVKVFERDRGRAGYVATLSGAIRATTASDNSDQPLELHVEAGSLLVTDEFVRAESLTGELARPGEPPGGGSVFRLAGEARMQRAELSSAWAGASVVGLDLRLPVEHLVAMLSPDAARLIRDIRQEHAPGAVLDATIDLSGDRESGYTVNAALSEIRGVELSIFGSSLEAPRVGGTVHITARTPGASASPRAEGADDRVQIRFSDLAGTWTSRGEPLGMLRLNGAIAVPADGTGVVLAGPGRVELRRLAIEREILRGAAAALGASEAFAVIDDWGAAGEVDADVTLEPGSDPGQPITRAAVRPRWLSVQRAQRRIELPWIAGQVTLADGRGLIEQLTLGQDDWELRLHGLWERSTEDVGTTPMTRVRGRAHLLASRFSEDLLAILPEGVRMTLLDAGVRIGQRVEVERLDLDLRMSDRGRSAYRATGEVAFRNADAEVGLSIRGADGRLAIALDQEFDDEVPRVVLDVTASRLRASGLSVTDAALRVRSGLEPGVLEVTGLSGATSSGRISGRAVVRQVGAQAEYEARIDLAGVRLADLLSDLDRAEAGARSEPGDRPGPIGDRASEREVTTTDDVPRSVPIPVPMDEAFVPGSGGDLSRGALDAELAVWGRLGDPASMRGRGAVRVWGGEVIRLPLVVPLLNLSNLQIPVNDRLDYFQASGWIEGNTIRFDEIGLVSDTLVILGWGTMITPGLDMDLRFISRGRMQLPLLTALFEGLRDELVLTVVRGRPDAPRLGLEIFAGARRWVSAGRVMGGPPADAEDRLRAERERARRREVGWSADAAARRDSSGVGGERTIGDATGAAPGIPVER
jgi:hypothetical protein